MYFGILIIDCVHNLCFDRLADGSCGILCQPSSGSPELFFSETSRQQGMLKLFRFKWLWNKFECRMKMGIKIQFARQLSYFEPSDLRCSLIFSSRSWDWSPPPWWSTGRTCWGYPCYRSQSARAEPALLKQGDFSVNVSGLNMCGHSPCAGSKPPPAVTWGTLWPVRGATTCLGSPTPGPPGTGPSREASRSGILLQNLPRGFPVACIYSKLL